MSKFIVKHKNSQISVVSFLSRNETVNNREVEIFNRKVINGFLRPMLKNSKRIDYKGPDGIPLDKYLKTGITIEEFFTVFVQILEAIKSAERNGLTTQNIVFNQKYIFVNTVTKQVNFIYQPVSTSQISPNIFAFVYDVIYVPTFMNQKEVDLINGLCDFLHHLQAFDVQAIEKFVLNVFPDAYKTVKRQKPGQSQLLYEHPWDDKGGSSSLDSSVDDDLETNILNEENLDEMETGLLADEDTGTDLYDDDDEMGTDILVEHNYVSTVYLIRTSTSEHIEVNKPVFRIGKEKSYVDYFVTNNNAVSRIHADIITREEMGSTNYYIKDNKSTNGTFVDGKRLQPECEEQIFNGNEITLGNEVFTFQAM